MKTRNVFYGLGILTAGVGIGTAMGVLYAPHSGRQTRKMISRAAEDGADFVAERSREIRRQAEGAFARGKVLAIKLVA
ncbi:MAG TPA: YtxH domain-containing protein [Terriglobia bacterium]|nr:YtxH domain-containing protein [Terriglobia bacterium]